MTTVAQAPRAVLVADPSDDLGRAARHRRAAAWVGGLGAALAVSIIAAISLGPVSIAPGNVWQVVGQHTIGWPQATGTSRAEDNIVWLVRTPRVLLGALVGAALAIAGVVLQALVRNVLADPYLLGVTSGASFGAALAILSGVGAGLGASALSGSAFAGALAATATVFLLARLGGRVTAIRLVMAGVAVGYILSAATSFVVFASDAHTGARSVLFWLLGSLGQARWSQLTLPALAIGASAALLFTWGRRLDALALGDDSALTLGVNPERLRIAAAVVVALCIGAAVAVSGAIGFVGLVVPHVARRLVGTEHRRVLVVAALLGAMFLVWADVAARVAFAPRELPLGIVTAVVGAPFLLLLIRRFHATTA